MCVLMSVMGVQTALAAEGSASAQTGVINAQSAFAGNSSVIKPIAQTVLVNKSDTSATAAGTAPTTSDNSLTAIDTDIAPGAPQVQEVYRLYNTVTSEHLFTADKNEYDTLKDEYATKGAGWKGEGSAWHSLTTSTTGVYRIYNAGLGVLGKMSHHYTTDKNEADTRVRENGWAYDNDAKPLFYSTVDDSASSLNGTSVVYRLYNDGLSAHMQTTDKNEHDDLVNIYR